MKRTFFSLDDKGELMRNEAIQPSWWIRFSSRLHVVYLLLDVGQRLPFLVGNFLQNLEKEFVEWRLEMEYDKRVHSPRADGIESDFNEGRVDSEDVANAVVVFQQLIHLWKESVEENGGGAHRGRFFRKQGILQRSPGPPGPATARGATGPSGAARAGATPPGR